MTATTPSRTFSNSRCRFVWHKETSLGDAEVVILPGGFSYGDYLRAGAISRFSPIMKAVSEHAREGRPLLGICNGFQLSDRIGPPARGLKAKRVASLRL